MRIIVLFVMVVVLGGCAHVMSDAGLKPVDRSLRYAELKKNPEALVGKQVLVGGMIAGTRSSGDVIMLEVVQLELFNNGVPDESSRSGGRFLALSSELIDPLLYRPGNFVTLIGEVRGKQIQKLESVDYPYPLIAVKELRMFRASEPFATYPNNPYQNRVGDNRLMLLPPGPPDGEPVKPR